jgi:hypothetical protein
MRCPEELISLVVESDRKKIANQKAMTTTQINFTEDPSESVKKIW